MEITFKNGTVLSMEAGAPAKYKYPEGVFQIVELDESQRDLVHTILVLILTTYTLEQLKSTDKFFQSNKKKLPVVIVEGLYSALSHRVNEIIPSPASVSDVVPKTGPKKRDLLPIVTLLICLLSFALTVYNYNRQRKQLEQIEVMRVEVEALQSKISPK